MRDIFFLALSQTDKITCNPFFKILEETEKAQSLWLTQSHGRHQLSPAIPVSLVYQDNWPIHNEHSTLSALPSIAVEFLFGNTHEWLDLRVMALQLLIAEHTTHYGLLTKVLHDTFPYVTTTAVHKAQLMLLTSNRQETKQTSTIVNLLTQFEGLDSTQMKLLSQLTYRYANKLLTYKELLALLAKLLFIALTKRCVVIHSFVITDCGLYIYPPLTNNTFHILLSDLREQLHEQTLVLRRHCKCPYPHETSTYSNLVYKLSEENSTHIKEDHVSFVKRCSTSDRPSRATKKSHIALRKTIDKQHPITSRCITEARNVRAQASLKLFRVYQHENAYALSKFLLKKGHRPSEDNVHP